MRATFSIRARCGRRWEPMFPAPTTTIVLPRIASCLRNPHEARIERGLLRAEAAGFGVRPAGQLGCLVIPESALWAAHRRVARGHRLPAPSAVRRLRSARETLDVGERLG